MINDYKLTFGFENTTTTASTSCAMPRVLLRFSRAFSIAEAL